MAKVAFLGLGVMGYPMAGHLAKKGGHDVTVYNRNTAKAEAWVKQFGGKLAKTPGEAAAGQDFVMMCVGNDNDVRTVAHAAFPKMGKNDVTYRWASTSALVGAGQEARKSKKTCPSQASSAVTAARCSGGDSRASSRVSPASTQVSALAGMDGRVSVSRKCSASASHTSSRDGCARGVMASHPCRHRPGRSRGAQAHAPSSPERASPRAAAPRGCRTALGDRATPAGPPARPVA